MQQLGRYREAIAAYDKVLELQPDHERAGVNRQQAVAKLAQSQEATATDTDG
jgi:hypothetical protein